MAQNSHESITELTVLQYTGPIIYIDTVIS